jgi:hypothetical protein
MCVCVCASAAASAGAAIQKAVEPAASSAPAAPAAPSLPSMSLPSLGASKSQDATKGMYYCPLSSAQAC